MNEVEKRYSKITVKYPRELLLLQGKGCFWKQCTFCDYFHDVSKDPFLVNYPAINMVTGEFGVLDVANSGSTMELDKATLNLLINKCKEKSIKELWLETHWAYRKKFKEFANNFKGVNVKYRGGIETFNTSLRTKWKKGIDETVTPLEISKYFQSVCLLVGVKGQSFEAVQTDIQIASKYFERFTINVFAENSTGTLRDEALVNRFVNEIYPKIKDNPQIDILLNITDLGLG